MSFLLAEHAMTMGNKTMAKAMAHKTFILNYLSVSAPAYLSTFPSQPNSPKATLSKGQSGQPTKITPKNGKPRPLSPQATKPGRRA
jgi:hypothetical protein